MTSTSHSPGFRPPSVTIRPGDARHHEDAAAGNHAATTAALGVPDASGSCCGRPPGPASRTR